MARPERNQRWKNVRPAMSVLVIMFVLGIVAVPALQAQTFTVLHTFTGGNDGQSPEAGLTLDGAGNLYGTTVSGGTHNSGVVFRLKHSASGWVLYPLYSFAGGNDDGSYPNARVVFGPNGDLYGTTLNGGLDDTGTIFSLSPPPAACKSASCPWTETVLHIFPDPFDTDGFYPAGDLTFDQEGNIYGVTPDGGAGSPYGCDGLGCGVVYKVTPSQDKWNESIIYAFTEESGGVPFGGVTLDHSGNLYGTASYSRGVIFLLTPTQSGWAESPLYEFHSQTDGEYPNQGLLVDPSGNFYTTTSEGGVGNGGTAVELQPSGGVWNFHLLYSFVLNGGTNPSGTLVRDNAGNLYGTAADGGAHGVGAVFKLAPIGSGWLYTSLHDFSGGSDGGFPYGGVTLDANGNLYGTAYDGGAGTCQRGCGVVWEITQ
jgi:uncharacterized repeat protein (TIGR03803 family)